MPHAIPNVSETAAPVRRAASANTLIARAKKNLGVTTVGEVATACGLSKSTLERLIANPQNAITRNLLAFSTTADIPLTDLLGTADSQPTTRKAA